MRSTAMLVWNFFVVHVKTQSISQAASDLIESIVQTPHSRVSKRKALKFAQQQQLESGGLYPVHIPFLTEYGKRLCLLSEINESLIFNRQSRAGSEVDDTVPASAFKDFTEFFETELLLF